MPVVLALASELMWRWSALRRFPSLGPEYARIDEAQYLVVVRWLPSLALVYARIDEAQHPVEFLS